MKRLNYIVSLFFILTSMNMEDSNIKYQKIDTKEKEVIFFWELNNSKLE